MESEIKKYDAVALKKPDDAVLSVNPMGKEVIALALAKAQAKFVQPEKNKVVTVKPRDGSPPYSFNYADYAAIVAAVVGPLAENGICFTHFLELTDRGNLLLVTQLIHSSGQFFECTWPIRSNSEPKSIGGDMTYGKRYCLSALTGCVADDDVDVDPVNTTEFKNRNAGGNQNQKQNQNQQRQQNAVKVPVPAPSAASKPVPKVLASSSIAAPPEPNSQAPKPEVSQDQLARLFAIATSAQWTNDQVKDYLGTRWGYSSTKELTREQYEMLVNIISTRGFHVAKADLRSLGTSHSPRTAAAANAADLEQQPLPGGTFEDFRT